MNAYISVDELASTGVMDVALSGGRSRRLRLLAEDVSRQVDRFTGRYFYSFNDTRHFSGNGKTRIPLPWDVVKVTALKEDDNGDGTFNVTWSSTDFHEWPYDHGATEGTDQSRPITALEVNLGSNGDQDVFLKAPRNYEIAGRFGYWERLLDTGAVAGSSVAWESSQTSLKVDSSTKVHIGYTLLVDSEQLYVTDRSTSNHTLTVTRAVNGTASASHAAGATIERYAYPGPIEEGVLMQTARLWTRRESGFGDNQLGLGESGQVGPTVRGLDADVRQMIMPYVKLRV